MPCESCINYVWDETLQENICMACLDEDELSSLMSHSLRECPYYRNDDEYDIVRHQN